MAKIQKKQIKMAKLLASIISSRDITDVLEAAINKTDVKSVDLDFTNVDFISRSAAHALLLMKEKMRKRADISFINPSREVTDMLRIVAANRAVPKKEKPMFNTKKTDIESLLKENFV